MSSGLNAGESCILFVSAGVASSTRALEITMKRIVILATLAFVIGIASTQAMACLTANCTCPSYHHC